MPCQAFVKCLQRIFKFDKIASLNLVPIAAIQALAHALKMNMFVGVINMEHNDIGTAGAKACSVPLFFRNSLAVCFGGGVVA